MAACLSPPATPHTAEPRRLRRLQAVLLDECGWVWSNLWRVFEPATVASSACLAVSLRPNWRQIPAAPRAQPGLLPAAVVQAAAATRAAVVAAAAVAAAAVAAAVVAAAAAVAEALDALSQLWLARWGCVCRVPPARNAAALQLHPACRPPACQTPLQRPVTAPSTAPAPLRACPGEGRSSHFAVRMMVLMCARGGCST